MRILFLSRWYPQPADNGSKLRVANLLSILRREHEVRLVAFASSETGSIELPPVPGASHVSVARFQEFNPRSLRALSGLFSATPRYLVDTYSPDMAKLVASEIQGSRPDLVIASQLSMAAYHKSFTGLPAILEELELGSFVPSINAGPALAGVRSRLRWRKHRAYVKRLLGAYQACTVASTAERALACPIAPDTCPVKVIPNFLDLSPYLALERRLYPAASLIFTGALTYEPNRDAVSWFVKEVFPLIKAQARSARLTVTGDTGPSQAPRAAGVDYKGRVLDVKPLLSASAVSIAPIRSGGGTRLKILEAMAARTPVVTTSKGIEGIDARNGEHLLISDTPDGFAAAVLSLLRNPERGQELAANAFDLVRQHYSSTAVRPTVLDLIRKVAYGRRTVCETSAIPARSVAIRE